MTTTLCPLPVPSHARCDLPQQAVLALAGVILLSAATLKVWQYIHVPHSVLQNSAPDWLTGPLLASFEFLMAVWLLCGSRSRRKRNASLVLFSIFSVVALYKWWTGAVSCGCFGQVEVRPWITATLDVSLVILLVVCRPRNNLAPAPVAGWRRAAGVGLAVALCSTAWGAWFYGQSRVVRTLATASDKTPEFPVGKLILIESKPWLNKPFPLATLWPDGQGLMQGRWRVFLYYHDCEHCRQTRPQVESQCEAGSVRTAMISIPPHSESDPTEPRGACLYLRLPEDRQWFAQTPVVLELQDGIVTAAAEGEDASHLLQSTSAPLSRR